MGNTQTKGIWLFAAVVKQFVDFQVSSKWMIVIHIELIKMMITMI